jgi:hypothetical protein
MMLEGYPPMPGGFAPPPSAEPDAPPQGGPFAGMPPMPAGPLYLAYSNGETNSRSRFDIIRIDPVFNGEVIPYTYTADPGVLVLTPEGDGPAPGGKIEFCFDGTETLRIRASGGLGLRFSMKFEGHEQFLDRLDGTVYAAFAAIGEFIFVPEAGTQTHNGKWITWMMKPADTVVDWTPDAAGNCSGYLHYAESSVEKLPGTRPFDDCVEENRADFAGWCEKYPPVPERYAHVRLFAIYVIWVCYMAPQGLLKTPTVYMMRTGGLMRAMGWQQSYQAMAIWKDIDAAVGLLHSMFTLQDEFGQLPDGSSDKYCTMLAPKPPFQGFALNYILERIGGIENLPVEHCALLYEPMCRWVDWWLSFRDRDGDGLVGYVHGDESGWDDASIFSKGTPVETPDIAAFLVLLMEHCGKFALRLGKKEEGDRWLEKSKTMLDRMIKTFWNGKKFIAMIDGSHEIVDTESIAVYQPVILGKRLPAEIINRIADTVGDPEKFLVPNGIASESQQSEFYDVSTGAFMLGMLLAPVQMMMDVGLYQAGRKDVALKAIRAWCEMSLQAGPQIIAMSPPQKNPPKLPEGTKPVLSMDGPMIPGGYCSWGAAVFLVLANILYEEELSGNGPAGKQAPAGAKGGN